MNGDAKVIQVIVTDLTVRGKGENESDPVRGVRQYWSFNGDLLAEFDPYKPNRDLRYSDYIDQVAMLTPFLTDSMTGPVVLDDAQRIVNDLIDAARALSLGRPGWGGVRVGGQGDGGRGQ